MIFFASTGISSHYVTPAGPIEGQYALLEINQTGVDEI
jgi:hypothetical protein